jgi:hypothetical protein
MSMSSSGMAASVFSGNSRSSNDGERERETVVTDTQEMQRLTVVAGTFRHHEVDWVFYSSTRPGGAGGKRAPGRPLVQKRSSSRAAEFPLEVSFPVIQICTCPTSRRTWLAPDEPDS